MYTCCTKACFRMNKTVCIIGKCGERQYKIYPLCSLWGLGTDTNCSSYDRVFEFHGLNNKATDKTVSPSILKYGLPLTNSICIMLATAYNEGYRHIIIERCPMTAKEEYISQARAVSYICGWLVAKGVIVEWLDSHIDFNFLYQSKTATIKKT